MIVIDASIAIDALLRTPRGLRAVPHVFHEERHAPFLIDLEFASSLRRMVRAGLDGALARTALETMRDWTIHRHAHMPLLGRIWELRDSLTAYDASYVALAEFLDAPLVTADAKIGRAHGHNARIVVLS